MRMLVALLMAALPVVAAQAQDAASPPHHACIAAALSTNQPVNARERVGKSAFMAFASYDPDGWPTITYTPAYFGLPPTVQAFLALHECGHLVLRTTDEFAANCYALQQGHWSRAELAEIELSHRSLGRLPPQYGGSGAAFWEGTRRACPDAFAVVSGGLAH